LSKAVNYWVDDRIRLQRVVPRTGAAFPRVRELSLEVIGTRAEVRQRGGIIPSWVIFGMIIAATAALCLTVTSRTMSQKRFTADQYQRMQQQVETLRRTNAALETEIRRLNSDPRAIEAAARARLNMTRPNEIIVPVE